MLTLCRLFIRADYSATEPEYEGLARTAFRAVEAENRERFVIFRQGTLTQARGNTEGTTEIVEVITGKAKTFFGWVRERGEFWDDVFALRDEARTVGARMRDNFPGTSSINQTKILTTRVTAGHLTQLIRIYRYVQAREYSYEEGFQQALAVFARAGDELTPEMERVLRDAVRSIRPDPKARIVVGGPSSRRGRYGRPTRGFEVARLPGAREPTRRPL